MIIIFSSGNFNFHVARVECPEPIHRASSHPIGTKNLPVWDLEMLETCIMAMS